MINISIQQLINLWVELEDAYNGVNKYGGDVAEIYAYTLQPRVPGYVQGSDTDFELNTAESLYNVLMLFQSKRECDISLNDVKLGKWLKEEPFIHRVHVKIVRINK